MLKEKLVELLRVATTSLPPWVEVELRKALREEKNPIARTNLVSILKNVKVAREQNLPLCQDTGLISFWVEFGEGFESLKPTELEAALRGAVEEATKRVLLRPNVVDPLSRRNTNTNLGVGQPRIRFHFRDDESVRITVVLKGGGCENQASLKLFEPVASLGDVEEFVKRVISSKGHYACPPLFVGVGIGGSSEAALELANEALVFGGDPNLKAFERKLLTELNQLDIGPMGLGGRATCLGVRAKKACCHLATLPVGVAINCWALRKATLLLTANGSSEVFQDPCPRRTFR